MALEEIKLWAMDGSGGATPLEAAERMESERLLEDTLVNNPDMLMPGLTLVGRQTRTEGGPLDLLGVDRDGRLALFELKRGYLNRDAVAQIIDYGSFLESKSIEELAQYISDRSGTLGTENIADFEDWYGENRGGQELSELRPIRLFLVGLGVDDTTTRMVRFLAEGGIDISLLTFLGFNHDGKTLLARQMQVEVPAEPAETTQPRRRLGRRRRRELLEQRIDEHTREWPEARELWDAVLEMFRENFPSVTEFASSGGVREWSKHRLRLHMPGGGSARAALQLGPFDLHPELVSLIFFPNAVDPCLDEFVQLRRELPYQTWPANSPRKEEGIIEIQFPLKSLAEWEVRKEKLAEITRSVYDALLASEEE